MEKIYGNDKVKCVKTTFDGFETIKYLENPFPIEYNVSGGDMLYLLN